MSVSRDGATGTLQQQLVPPVKLKLQKKARKAPAAQGEEEEEEERDVWLRAEKQWLHEQLVEAVKRTKAVVESIRAVEQSEQTAFDNLLVLHRNGDALLLTIAMVDRELGERLSATLRAVVGGAEFAKLEQSEQAVSSNLVASATVAMVKRQKEYLLAACNFLPTVSATTIGYGDGDGADLNVASEISALVDGLRDAMERMTQTFRVLGMTSRGTPKRAKVAARPVNESPPVSGPSKQASGAKGKHKRPRNKKDSVEEEQDGDDEDEEEEEEEEARAAEENEEEEEHEEDEEDGDKQTAVAGGENRDKEKEDEEDDDEEDVEINLNKKKRGREEANSDKESEGEDEEDEEQDDEAQRNNEDDGSAGKDAKVREFVKILHARVESSIESTTEFLGKVGASKNFAISDRGECLNDLQPQQIAASSETGKQLLANEAQLSDVLCRDGEGLDGLVGNEKGQLLHAGDLIRWWSVVRRACSIASLFVVLKEKCKKARKGPGKNIRNAYSAAVSKLEKPYSYAQALKYVKLGNFLAQHKEFANQTVLTRLGDWFTTIRKLMDDKNAPKETVLDSFQRILAKE